MNNKKKVFTFFQDVSEIEVIVPDTFSNDLFEVRSTDDGVSITENSELTKNVEADINASASTVKNSSQEKLPFASRS